MVQSADHSFLNPCRRKEIKTKCQHEHHSWGENEAFSTSQNTFFSVFVSIQSVYSELLAYESMPNIMKT